MELQNEDQLEARMLELRKAYSKELPALLKRIQGFFGRVISSQAKDREALSEVYRLVHSITGSGPSFGFHYLGELAHELEALIDKVLKEPEEWNQELSSKAGSLLREMRKAPLEPEVDVEQRMKHVPKQRRKPEDASDRPLAWIGKDPRASEQVRSWLALFGIESTYFSHPDAVLMKGKKFRCDAVIVDFGQDNEFTEWEDGLSRLKASMKRTPQLFLVPDALDLGELILAYERGSDGCYAMPVDFFDLVNKLDEIIGLGNEGPYRLLIVEDDAALASHIGTIMRKAGLEVAILNDPMGIEALLDGFNPELILMDLYLGKCSGNALAKLIRQKEAYRNIPIVYISTETEVAKRLEAFEVGADDFLLKPVKYHYLYYTLYSRLKRSRLLEVNLNRDSLTGLLDQSSIRQKLADAVSEAKSSGEPLTFALIDLDEIGKVNAALGNAGGDIVLKTLAKLLDMNVRGKGWAGRYGGKEFSLVLPGMDESQARAFFEPLRAGFAEIVHGQSDTYPGLCASFCAGLVSTVAAESPAKIAGFALRALRSAQMQGGNCLVFTEVSQRSSSVAVSEPTVPRMQVDFDDELIFFHEDDDETKTMMVAPEALAREHAEDGLATKPGSGPEAHTHAAADEENPQGSSTTIVIVDDEKQILSWLSTQLKELGYSVHTALSGEEGYQLVEKHQPEILLTDLLLFPGIHGFELCQKVRANKAIPRVGIVVMSAHYRDDRYRREATDAGADVFITKPIDFPILNEALTTALNAGK